MIPFGVKILWFVLSLTGLISSWLVLIPFGGAVGAMWGPLLYCVGNTLLQGIFCLGMIWRMDPFLMPKGFCIAQTLIIGFATFFLTGVAGAFSMATSIAVLWPRSWGDKSALKWRNIFLVPVALFPAAATVAHTIIVLKFSSAKPTDDLHCDSSDPEWVRFLSYAGVPFIISLPCTFYSIKSLVIIWRTSRNTQRTNKSLVFESVGNYTSMLPRSLRRGSVNIVIRDPDPPTSGYQTSPYTTFPMSAVSSAPSFVTANEHPPSPETTPTSPSPLMVVGRSPTFPSERKFHLPFRPSVAGIPAMDSLTEGWGKRGEEGDHEEDVSDVSSAVPVFRTPVTQKKGLSKERNEAHSRRVHPGGVGSEVSEVVWEKAESNFGDGLGGTIEARQRASRMELRDDDSDVLGSGDVPSGRYMTPMEFISQPSEESAAKSSFNLVPAIWRIILFQTAFCAVQVLVCISTIVDLATHRKTPIPLGTQHFALLLAAWGPAVVFGHTPAVRKSLKFWGGEKQ